MINEISNYEMLSRFQNKKCYFGLGLYTNQKIFFKEFNSPLDKEKEIKGYQTVKRYYVVPQMVSSVDNTIIYEYKDELINSSLYEYLYFDIGNINLEGILNQYKNSLKNIKKINEKDTFNNKFFKDRIKMIDQYLLLINDLNLSNQFNEMKKVIQEDKKLHAFISQGDPTDTNISTNGCFTDFENGGYNSLVGEIAIFIVSILTHGGYFYPKYNSNVYQIRSNYKVNTTIKDKNKTLIIAYLNMIKNNVSKDIIDEINKYLKYYICFRLVTPLDVTQMDEDDQNIIFSLFEIFFQIENIDELINLISNWDISYIDNNLYHSKRGYL